MGDVYMRSPEIIGAVWDLFPYLEVGLLMY